MDETEQNIIKSAVKGESNEQPSEEIFIPSPSVSNILQNPREDIPRFPTPPGYEGMQPSIMTGEPDENGVSQQTNAQQPPASQNENEYRYPVDYNVQQGTYQQPEAIQDPY